MNISALNKSKWIALIVGILLLLLANGLNACSSPRDSYATKDFATIAWPGTSSLAAMLPTPESTWGEVWSESSDRYSVEIGNTTKTQYDSYVNACMEKGFTVDYYKGESSFHADNAEGYHLSISYYEDDRYMSISLDAPDQDSEGTAETEQSDQPAPSESDNASESTDDSGSSDQSSLNPEFKAAMDSYEQFFDQYIDFMKKYSESSDPTSLLGEYSEFMQKYTDTMNAMNAWDSSEMTPEESAYYLEVTNRINQKLLEAAV